MSNAAFAAIGLAVLAIALGALAAAYLRRSKRAEAEAAEAGRRAARSEATLATAPLGCLVIAPGGARVHGQPALMAALGLDGQAEPALGAIPDAFEAADAKRLSSALAVLRNQGNGFELRLQRKHGGRVLEVRGTRARAAGGAAGGAEANADLLWFHDVTEMVGETARVRAECAGLEALLDDLPLPIWRRDGELKLVYCNRAYGRAVDREPAAALTEAVELLGKVKAAAGRAIATRALASGAPESESHHVVVEGSRRLLEIGEHPTGNGTLIGLAVDRTEVEELEAELRRHIGAHGAVLENLGSAIAIFGPDFKLRFFNGSYAHLSGLDEDFLRREPELGDILEALREARRLPEQSNFPEYKREWLRGLKTLIDPMEELLHLPDGSTLRSFAIPHPFGGVLLTYEDVTDRLSLESSYNTLIEVQRETLDNLYEGVAVYGADGRLKLSNPAFARIWDLPESLLGNEPHVRELVRRSRSFFEVSDEDWQGLMEARVARATEPEPRSGRRGRADGSVVDWSLMPLPDGASLFTFLDVTDSVRVERALRERAEAIETADRLKSEFVANISYELRTPLNAIVGFAEILENQFFGELNERQLEYSRDIVRSSERLTVLINDILDLASIEAGYLQLDVASVDLHALIESVETLAHERAHHQNIDLKMECPEDIGTIEADGRRLKQALFNLLSNAIKFTPDGGAVTVSVERADDEVRLAVADTGSGIRPEDIERVFGKFETGRGQSGQTGAGLGLSLVKSLIEMHGGWVGLDSKRGVGTKVVCHVPLEPPPAAPTEA
ncbi:MAG: PAS-domain containing protein [Alphaproteobacteria bacterium]